MGGCDFGGPGPCGARWMDAVELPLPAKVEFGKILAPAAAVEGVDGPVVGGGGPGGGGGEVLRRCADADRRHGGGIAPLLPLFSCRHGGRIRCDSDFWWGS